MRIVIPGGTGQLGRILERHFVAAGHTVDIISRNGPAPSHRWNGVDDGPWSALIDGADVVINLAGRSVDCRYTKDNLATMMASRVDSTAAVGRAIAAAERPPAVWLQMSTATIYAHRFDAANDEATGVIGGHEPDVPPYWRFSVDIATAWERAQADADTPHTRKVALRTAMVMSPDRGGVFDLLSLMTRLGLGGSIAGGAQYVSWIHGADFARAVDLLIARGDISGPVNLAAPDPRPQRDFMADLRAAWGVPIGLPATRWMCSLGALVMGTDAELLLKSRRVVPGRLTDAGFVFDYPDWRGAAADLAAARRGAVPAAA